MSELKIDKVFVRDIVVDVNDREICATVNALARTLGLGSLMLGLILVTPMLAHASWHAYRDLVESDA